VRGAVVRGQKGGNVDISARMRGLGKPGPITQNSSSTGWPGASESPPLKQSSASTSWCFRGRRAGRKSPRSRSRLNAASQRGRRDNDAAARRAVEELSRWARRSGFATGRIQTRSSLQNPSGNSDPRYSSANASSRSRVAASLKALRPRCVHLTSLSIVIGDDSDLKGMGNVFYRMGCACGAHSASRDSYLPLSQGCTVFGEVVGVRLFKTGRLTDRVPMETATQGTR
jgi:hypothetical protein